MLTEKDYAQIREELRTSERPLFLFHDDPDGLSSFLLLYKMVERGAGMLVKSVPKIDERFVKAAKDPAYDKIFIMDIAVVEQSFIDQVKKPIIWIDHHQPLKRSNVKYFNPRVGNVSDNYPASYLCYKVNGDQKNLWIAMTGVVGDWMLPEFAHEFAERYSDLWKDGVKKPDDAMYETKLGTLIKIFSFILKGPVSDGIKCFKMLTRISEPYEILNKASPSGKYLYDKFERINGSYEKVLEDAKKCVTEEKFVIYIYKGSQGYSGEVANEILHFYPDRVIIVGRERDGEVRMSLRGSGNNVILPKLKKALEGVDGYGGGHEYACGAAVKDHDFPRFVESFKNQF